MANFGVEVQIWTIEMTGRNLHSIRKTLSSAKTTTSPSRKSASCATADITTAFRC